MAEKTKSDLEADVARLTARVAELEKRDCCECECDCHEGDAPKLDVHVWEGDQKPYLVELLKKARAQTSTPWQMRAIDVLTDFLEG